MIHFIKTLNRYVRFPLLLASLLIIAGIIQFFLMVRDIEGEHYDIKLFQLSPETIRSAKTVEDTEKTEEDKEKVANEVNPVYTFSPDIGKNQAAIIKSTFDYIIEAQKTISEEKKKSKKESLRQEQIKNLRERLDEIDTEGQTIRLTDQEISTLLAQNNEDLINARDVLTSIILKKLSESIRQEQVVDAKASVEQSVRENFTIPESIRSIAIALARTSIVETEKKDNKLTKERIEEAKASVDPTRILQGQIIVQEGQLIDRDVYHQLEITGMLSNKQSTKPIIGLGLFIFLQMAFFYAAFYNWKADSKLKTRNLIITMIIYLSSIIVMKLLNLVTSEFDVNIGFLFPAAVIPMLILVLVNERIALLTTTMTAAVGGIVFQEGYSSVLQMEVSLYIIFSGFASIYFMRNAKKRSSVMKTSLYVAAVNIAFISFYLLLSQSNYGAKELAYYIIAAISSAILSGALMLGLLPFIESAFGMLTTYRLIELANPNHPLLKKILVETPGTYHHSIMVANLADAACEAIGADGLLARVGCYYHDIGKTRRPGFFVENQMSGINPHDQLPTTTSKDIIIAHVEDGAKILEQHKMPKEIVDVARQHHGTSLVKYFFFKEKENNPDVEESEFRYAGPKPQTKEIAIISVADSVEAAVRSMKTPTSEGIKQLVHNIVQDKLQDGQFDECDLSIRELKTVEYVFCATLNGIFHSRIEYPKPK
ncbi:HD family phosphohydrolase [Rummeliibacillus suwonensis]|uniref:HD family phosphohydrolase n=1 Tax=Rummeliibacillus suwonensis TaxID=1306154 RepID=UPI0028A120B6|nr:HD family phosphohydrolase [Rummeliibacillus suwonensis]